MYPDLARHSCASQSGRRMPTRYPLAFVLAAFILV